MPLAVDFGALEDDSAPRIVDDPNHAQPLRSGERPHLRLEFDVPGAKPAGRLDFSDVVHQVHPPRIRAQVVDERERPLGRTGHRRLAFDLHRCSSSRPSLSRTVGSAKGSRQQRAASGEQAVEVVGFVERRCPRADVRIGSICEPIGRVSGESRSRSRVAASAPRLRRVRVVRRQDRLGPARGALVRAVGAGQWRAKQIGGPDLGGRRASIREAPPSSWRDAGTAPLRRDRSVRATGRSRTPDPRRACRTRPTPVPSNRDVRTAVPSMPTLAVRGRSGHGDLIAGRPCTMRRARCAMMGRHHRCLRGRAS